MLTRRSALTLLACGVSAPAIARAQAAPELTEMAYSKVSPRNLLDLHRPQGDGPFPVLLDIHGGGFLTGDKRLLAVPTHLLEAGIAVVRMNYRLSQQAIWPAQHEDVLAAAHFLHARAHELGLMPGRLALGGRSAGAFMAVSAALSLARQGQPPAAVVDFYGPMDFGSMDADMRRQGIRFRRPPADSADSAESLLIGYAVGARRDKATAMSPVGRLDGMAAGGMRLPPLMIRHGRRDSIVSAAQAGHLRRAWQRVDPQATVDFLLLQHEGHGTRGFGGDPVLTDLAGFLSRHLNAGAP